MNNKGYNCPSCQQGINGFRDKLSKKEFQISGLCQECQDKTFSPGKTKKPGSLSEADLISFQEAIFKDYGIKLEGQELYDAAFNLFQFIEALVKFSRDDEKNEPGGSKVVQDNPLYTDKDKHKIK